MKIIKKIAAIMLSVMMVLGMCSVVGAEGAGTTSGTSAPTGSIKISNAIVKQEYKIYRILELESYDKTNGLYSYKPNSSWEAFFDDKSNPKGAGSDYITVDDNGYARWKGAETDERKREFAKLALEYAKDKKIPEDAKETANASDEGATTTELTFQKLPLGYYLVDSSAGALCSLNTTNPDVTIEEKNGVPSVKKEVQEDSKENQTDAWGDENTADIGQIVNFKTTITAKKGAENYVLHDTMSDGLTFDANSVNVKLKKNNDGSEETLQTPQYTLVKPGAETEGTKCTFEVKFEKVLCDTLENDDQLIVTYSATLNEKAVIGETGNTNEAKLEYGDKNTISSKTITKTYEIPVFKYTNKNGTDTALEGVVFELYRDADCKTKIEFIKKEKEGEYDCYRIKIGSESNSVSQITTSATGKFKISGLDADTYYLKEVTAPKGYNKLSAPVKITIGENGTITVDDKAIAGTNVEVENKSGSLLPSTGGMGTTLFYIFGAILVIGSGVVLITKKRMK